MRYRQRYMGSDPVDPAAMPAPRVNNRYRSEEVDLQPGGATISVVTQADNPYENEGDIQIVTQESGGMADPDTDQTTAGQVWKGSSRMHRGGSNSRLNRMGNRPSGTAPVRTSVVSANSPQNSDGTIDDDDNEDGSSNGMFGLGNLGVDYSGVDMGPDAPLNPATPTTPAATTQGSSFDWSKFLTAAVPAIASSAGGIVQANYAQKTAAANASAAASQAQAASYMSRMGNQVAANVKSNWPVLVGGAAVLGLGIYLLSRKGSSAPKTNPRRRSRR